MIKTLLSLMLATGLLCGAYASDGWVTTPDGTRLQQVSGLFNVTAPDGTPLYIEPDLSGRTHCYEIHDGGPEPHRYDGSVSSVYDRNAECWRPVLSGKMIYTFLLDIASKRLWWLRADGSWSEDKKFWENNHKSPPDWAYDPKIVGWNDLNDPSNVHRSLHDDPKNPMPLDQLQDALKKSLGAEK